MSTLTPSSLPSHLFPAPGAKRSLPLRSSPAIGRGLRVLALSVWVVVTAAWAQAGDPSGKWTWEMKGPQGRSLESTLTLVWKAPDLTGTIDNRAGKVAIQQAKFSDETVVFTVEREFRGRKFVTHYEGKLDGDRITGSVKTTGRDERPVTLPWEARRKSGQ